MSSTRASSAASDAVACGPVWVSPGEMCEARVRDRPVRLSVPNQRMLAFLIRSQGRVVSRDELYRQAGGKRLPRHSRAVDVHIFRIRRALGAFGRFLLSVPGRGYRMDVRGLERAR